MIKKITLFFVFLFVYLIPTTSALPVSVHASEENKNILILNSYHSGFTWTDNQTQGIISSFTESSIACNISAEYLDWKRYPYEEYLSNIYNNLKLKYSNKKIDVLICTDDAAFSFATKYRKELFSDAPIVFSGINSEGLTELGSGISNYTGVLEQIDPFSTIQIAKNLNPSLDTIYLVYEDTESGLSTGEICIQAAKQVDKNLNVISLNKLHSSDILDAVKQADSNSIILMTTFSLDYDKQYLSHEHFCMELSHTSSAPLYHLYDFGLNHGVLGGRLTSGRMQGESAGKLALRVLHGEEASSIPVIKDDTNQYMFDYTLLKKYDIAIKDLPNGSTLINEPFSFIKTYKNLVISVVTMFILLFIFTLILLIYIKKIKTMKITLEDNNIELTKLNNDLSSTEEEIRNHYIELSNAHLQLKERNDELFYHAHHDTLTGLKNRHCLHEEVESLLKDHAKKSALLFIDMDNFKFVNDALGHNIGDDLIIQVSNRLASYSSKDRFLFRLGGDEFVFFLYDISNKNEAYKFASDIIKNFSSPFRIQENTLMMTLSIGISLFPDNGTNIDILLRNADMAMYKVKDKGRNGVSMFSPVIKEELLERINIEKYFDKGLKEQEFTLHYQPLITANSCEIAGFEALVRWCSPELGMLSPLKFITIAEETGFIITLGEWILRSSCQYIKKLNQQHNKNYKISVNISVIQLMQDNFVTMVQEILTELSFPPHLLELEITESVIMDSSELLSNKFLELRQLGVRIALDDFGTGYSSLAYLKLIPITTLKLDKLFIDDITKQDSEIHLANTLIDLGHKMNLTIIAEGVETKEQAEYLRTNRCDLIQGYYYSKPLNSQALELWLSEHC